MAQGLMEYALRQAEIDGIAVESAGVFAVEGMGATRETQRVLQEIGVDVSTHHARMLTPRMVEEADLIFVMEQFQAEQVLRRAPGTKNKIHLLRTYGMSKNEMPQNPNISDPIGKPLEVYEVCFADIREAIDRIIKSLGTCRT